MERADPDFLAQFEAISIEPTRLSMALEHVDLEALQKSLQGEREFRQSRYFAVLDTEFFRSAFRSHLRYGMIPFSLSVAQEGKVKLFMAQETVVELFQKLPEFARSMGVETVQLELLLDEWAPWIWVVDLPYETTDHRVELVAARDHTDRPAAALAAFLSPCILLSRDKDFEALEIAEPSDPLVAIRASVNLGQASVEVRTMFLIPVMPVGATVGGIGWVGKKVGVNPWLLGAAVLAFLVIGYRRLDSEKKATARKALGEFGTHFAEELAAAQERQRIAIAVMQERVVPAPPRRSSTEIVLRELARVDEPASAQRLWESMDEVTRPSVGTVREILRSHLSTWPCPGRGQWSFGIPMSELLEIWSRAA